MDEIDIPASWDLSAGRILSGWWRKILVIGAVDCGKSTYCRFLSRRLMEAGSKVAILDADVGQKDIGPPACITLGYPAPSPEHAVVKPARYYFIGAVNPVRHLLPMVVGVRQMLDSARSSSVIINTTGLIHGIGRVLKSYKIEAVKPNVIVAIQRTNELESLIRAYRNHRIVRIVPSNRSVSKTPEQRKAARERAFRGYFRDAREVSLDLKQLIVQRSLLFSGKAIEDCGFLYCEKTSEGVLAVTDDPGRPEQEVRTLPTGFEQNLLCGVADQRNLGLGLAIVQEIDFSMATVSMVTPVRPEEIRVLQFGDLYLGRDGFEIDRRRPRHF